MTDTRVAGGLIGDPGIKLGLVARGDNRGLGNMTAEFARHMRPERVLCVDMGPTSVFDNHWDRYRDFDQVRVLHQDGRCDDAALQEFVSGLDVLYTAETPYDYRLFDIAREQGARSYLHFMYEFFRFAREPHLPKPDVFLAPSPWNLDRVSLPHTMIAVPVARDRLVFRKREKAKVFMHVIGHRAMADRNGTRIVYEALRFVRSKIIFRLHGQDNAIGMPRGVSSSVQIELNPGDQHNYWDLYEGADVLVQPRRYGGLSLPMQEAASLGMPIISLNVEPQRTFLHPGLLVPARILRRLNVQVGQIDCYQADPRDLARVIDRVASEPGLCAAASETSDQWAQSLDWEAMEPVYRGALV